MRTLAALALVLLTAAPGLAFPGDTRAYCARLHESYSLQKYCIGSETAAQERVTRRYYSFQSIDRDIYNYCGRLHESWDLMEYCIKSEERAKASLAK